MPPQIIRHWVNSTQEASALAPGLGAEVDVRSQDSRMFLAHDAFARGPDLKDFLDIWASAPKRGPLILNPKEDGLEGAMTLELAARKIDDFFILDLPMPTIVREINAGNRHIAIRVSEYEPVVAAMAFSGRTDWVWLDSFSGSPISRRDCASLIDAGFRLCLVSPELQGRPIKAIDDFKPLADMIDAVCTKHPDLWGSESR